MKQLEYELVDHGIDGSQYFQGCGVSGTNFNMVATGIGNNPAEAIDDCLEQIASMCQGIDVEELEQQILKDNGWKKFPVKPEVEHSEDEEDEPSELFYHVSIRYNVAEELESEVAGFNQDWLKYKYGIYCKNGGYLSVQVGGGNYCSPRNNEGPWTAVEVGFVEGMPLPHGWSHSGDGIFGWVPIEQVYDFIMANGGIDVERTESSQHVH